MWCEGKKQYRTWRDANRVLKRVTRSRNLDTAEGERLEIYWCSTHGAYEIGAARRETIGGKRRGKAVR